MKGNELKIDNMDHFVNEFMDDRLPLGCSYDPGHRACRCLLSNSIEGIRMEHEEQLLNDLIVQLMGPKFNKFKFIRWQVLIEHSRTRFGRDLDGICGEGETIEEAAADAKAKFDTFSSRALRSRRETWITALSVKGFVGDMHFGKGCESWWAHYNREPHWSSTEYIRNHTPLDIRPDNESESNAAAFETAVRIALHDFRSRLVWDHKMQTEDILDKALTWFRQRALIKKDAMEARQRANANK